MLEYQYLEGQTIDDVNFYAGEGWRVDFIIKEKGDSTFEIFLAKGTDPVETQTLELSQQLQKNVDTGARFYLNSEISYGDILITILLTIFLVLGITKFFLNFFIPKFMNFKK